MKFNKPEYLELWKGLKAAPATPEILRNVPLRHPLLWRIGNTARFGWEGEVQSRMLLT
jgi:hypothetical protein